MQGQFCRSSDLSTGLRGAKGDSGGCVHKSAHMFTAGKKSESIGLPNIEKVNPDDRPSSDEHGGGTW